MRLEEGKEIYNLAGQDALVSVKRLWDDSEEHDWLSHIEIDGMQFRVEAYCQSQSRYTTPGAHWVLQRLGPEKNSHVMGGHNRREDAVLIDGKTKVWIVDEPEKYRVHPDDEYAENWITQELLSFTALFLPQSMEEYTEELGIALPDDGPLETPVGKSVMWNAPY